MTVKQKRVRVNKVSPKDLKIPNGEVRSFKSGRELVDHLKTLIEVESLDPKGEDYNHVQEVRGLTYRVIPYMKGVLASAHYIQDRGNFNEFTALAIKWLSIRRKEIFDELKEILELTHRVMPYIKCKEILEELAEISDAAGVIFESDRRQKKEGENSAVPA